MPTGSTERTDGTSSQGEQARLAAVLAEFGPGLRRMTGAYATDPADREDLFQEIAIGLWRALPVFREEASLRTFVYRIARNRCLTFRTKVRRRDAREVLFTPGDFTGSLDGVEPVFPVEVERAQRSRRLRAAVGRLPEDLRCTLLLRLDGLSDREIGRRLGITANATGVRLFRARRSLRNLIDPLEMGAFDEGG